MAAAGLIASLSDGALRALAQGLRSGSLSAGSSVHRLADVLAMDAEKAASLRDALAASGTDGAGLALACECALASRRDSAAAELSKLIEVVLSGPLVEGVEMRDTAVVFSSLMREAREEVLVTSFIAGYARELLAPLADFLDADPTRRATIVLNFQRGDDTTIESDLAARLADDFWTRQWPRGARRPTLCYDPRGLAMDKDARATMHAKVVVIDRRKAFVTSANLTARAQSENIELGVLVNHPPIAARIAGYFEALLRSATLIEVR
jgi:phosphatidylserine/phosphatidylglycerophosphate/cardiolipin synthase-like enzyme